MFGKFNFYTLGVWTRRGLKPSISKRYWYKEPYDDYVYCVKVSSGIVLVRRNGKCCWSGNCGFDFGDITNGKKDKQKRIYSHYYQEEEDCQHTGIGNTRSYFNRDPIEKFGCFVGLEGIKIINVSLKSNIHCFEKIGYDEFFEKLKTIPNINQEELRIELKGILKQYAITK